MSEHTKKHPIKAHSQHSTLYVTFQRHTYAIPKTVMEKYEIDDKKIKKIKKIKKVMTPTEEVEAIFAELDKQYTRPGALLKGLRYREDLTQVEFAKKLGITQANLSNMENGKRPIGKEMAKRIGKIFGANYRHFL